MGRWRLVYVRSCGTRPATLLIGGGTREVQEQIWPASPRGEALRQARLGFGLGLREAAYAVGLTGVELSSLQTGRALMADADDWARLTEEMRVVAARACTREEHHRILATAERRKVRMVEAGVQNDERGRPELWLFNCKACHSTCSLPVGQEDIYGDGAYEPEAAPGG